MKGWDVPRKPQLEEWEVALIRAMLTTGKYTKQQIVAYFTRPERSINQGRISEIEDNHERYLGIEAATIQELDSYLAEWNTLRFPSAPVVHHGPTHPIVLAEVFKMRRGEIPKIAVSETSTVEGKESFNWGSADKYCKTLAGMANNKGGYLLFGVKDGSFEIVGIDKDRMEKFDLKRANEFITRNFNQALELDKGSFEIGGKTIGVLYVQSSINRPVICRMDNKTLKSGAIYYRYPGETREIQAPELEVLLTERDVIAEQSLIKMVSKIGSIGTSNSAVINLQNGVVEGEKSSFIMDESLLDKVKFVSQGHFDEDEGAPALKLIGDVRPLKEGSLTVEQTVIGSINERNLWAAFLGQENNFNNKACIQAQTHLQPVWLPIYYFAVLEGLNLEGLIKMIETAETPYEGKRKQTIKRVISGAAPKGLFLPAGNQYLMAQILSGNLIDVRDEDEAKLCLLALRMFSPDEVSLERVLEITRELYGRFGNSQNLKTSFRYLIADLDLKWFRPQLDK
ncbi:ATP-binding protein [Terasakiella sp. A23]|uniref:ATP-binding protein n=1 Tax=Terasakiella sp. FCG-A23 TaxID=3080561 RepID=UPI002954B521|nr:ATP-binding protein [Terasakiella sp. A23]MDV7338791.1 ATP-binding protein [Terasakiella sp. A23]